MRDNRSFDADTMSMQRNPRDWLIADLQTIILQNGVEWQHQKSGCA